MCWLTVLNTLWNYFFCAVASARVFLRNPIRQLVMVWKVLQWSSKTIPFPVVWTFVSVVMKWWSAWGLKHTVDLAIKISLAAPPHSSFNLTRHEPNSQTARWQEMQLFIIVNKVRFIEEFVICKIVNYLVCSCETKLIQNVLLFWSQQLFFLFAF